MEPDHIDAIFRKSISESKNYFDAEATLAKASIWGQVQYKKKKQVVPLLFRLLVAACILLFLSFSIITISHLKARKTIDALVVANTDLENQVAINTKKASIKNEKPIATILHTTDTVFIEKQVVVTKSIVQKELVTDTVYISQIVYVEKPFSAESTIAIENSLPIDSTDQIITENYKKEILIGNTESMRKDKRKKIRLKFGGNQNPGNDGAIALSSR